MNRKQLNQLQRRSIKSTAAKYDKLVPKTECDVVFKGHGSASEILSKMSGIASKYAHQVKEVAQSLVKSSLPLTIDAFYRWQLDHIQYDVDGKDQRLRSPSCLWYERKKGGDCKSFAIMSAALCVSQNIRCHLRQIKVAGTQDQNRINHVFVIVPVDQKNGTLKNGYYVLDSSSKINKEAPNYWFNDMEVDLPYYGMNAAHTCSCNSNSGMNCGCGGDSSKNKDRKVAAYNKFQDWLDDIVNKGANVRNMQAASNFLYRRVLSGIDPVIKIDQDGIKIDGKLFLFENENLQGMNFDFSALTGGGTATGTAGAAVGSAVLPGIGTAVGGFVGNLFGDFLNNGFRVDCIGGAWYDGDDEGPHDKAFMDKLFGDLTSALQTAINNQNSNRIAQLLQEMLGKSRMIAITYREKRVRHGYNSCTNDGLEATEKIAQDFHNQIKNELIPQLQQYFNVTKNTTQRTFSHRDTWLKEPLMRATHIGGDPITHTEFGYTVTPKANAASAQITGSNNTNNSNGLQTIDDQQAQSASMGGSSKVAIGLAILTAAGLAYSKFK
jgi:hypothetical protein